MKVLLCFIVMFMLLTGCENTAVKNDNHKAEMAKKQAAQVNNEQEKKEQKKKEEAATDKLLGKCETVILDKDEERVNNLNISARALDGLILEPGETFSFNESVGRRTKEKGYEEARILVGCKKGYAVGGGVCQVSSTLYNAAQYAGMEIVERHSHSKNVHYVKLGQDAAISYGTLDLKFKNTRDKKVKIAISTDGNKVYASLWEIS